MFLSGKFGHYSRDWYRRKYHESKHRNIRHTGHFDDGGETMNDDFKNLKLFISYVALFAKIDDSNAWFVYSGASIHMSCNKNWFENYHETSNGANIYLGDDHSHQIRGYGDVSVTLPNGCVKQIQNVMYVPSIKKNLISVSTVTYQDLKVEFLKSHCVVKYMQDHYKIIAIGVRVRGLYNLDVKKKSH
jgi:hypothetical protein